ncbi:MULTISPECIES: YcnI family protein [Paracoccus]|nr:MULTISPECIES: YcnI family protein [Paracoccus]
MKTAITVLLLAAPLSMPAMAHIHLNPEQAQRGETVELAFVVGHGCAGAPTTALRVALPVGLADVVPVEKPGWQVSVLPDEIGWQGGPLADGRKEGFSLRATLTADAPDTIAIPVIQICGDIQTRWIEPGANADNPAPVLRVLPAR